MTKKNPRRKLLKIIVILTGIVIILLIGFHFWFRAHAKKLIEDLVETRSHGKLKMKIHKMKFGYFSRKMELENVVFYNTDTVNEVTAYRFSVDKINLQVKALLPIILSKELLIDSISLLNPHIQVTRLKAIEKPDNIEAKDVSIPEEMGKIYTSIQDALRVLQVGRFQIINGTFTLINKIQKDQLPINISNLHFQIDNLQVDTTTLTGNEKILFSDNVMLRSADQDILFPDGRHRISFSHFSINLARRLVQFDSCTIAATRGDSSGASFSVFFDALMLTNIDFDTLYKSEVIKADSVYCVNPRFNLDVETGKRKGSTKPPPKLEDLVKQLTGDLQLETVVVSNADFNITTTNNGVPTSYTFSNNNFEMQGLTINQDAKKPLKVRSFAMAIRNYENFIKDSSYSIRFDSVLFRDDRITLSNFVFNKLDNGKILNTFSIPQFNLQGLSWDALVFERRLQAEQAIMFNPTISYTVNNKKKGADRQTIFQSLGSINEYMDLQYLDVLDGNIDLKIKKNLRLQLENANLSVKSNSLLTSTKISGIKNSLTSLNFKHGRIRAGNLLIEMNDIHYVGQSGQFGAGEIELTDDQKKLAVALREVNVARMQVDETTGSIVANDVSWRNGDVTITGFGSSTDNEAVIDLSNVKGGRTTVNANAGGKSIATKLESISFTRLLKRPGNKLQLAGLDLKGSDLRVDDEQTRLRVAAYDITDNAVSTFREILFTSTTSRNQTKIQVPAFTAMPHIQPLLNGSISMDEVKVNNPVVDIKIIQSGIAEKKQVWKMPLIEASSVAVAHPLVTFSVVKDSATIDLSWYGNKNNADFIQMNTIKTNASTSSIGNLNFFISNFNYQNSKGTYLNTSNGKLAGELRDISFFTQDEAMVWKAHLAEFDARDFQLDSIGVAKSNIALYRGTLRNLNLSSSHIGNLQKLVAANTNFRLDNVTGSFDNAQAKMEWFKVGFNRNDNSLSADSFFYRPALELDSFLQTKEFQTDYMTVSTGRISIGPFDFDAFVRENKINIGTASIDNLLFTDYKDKNLPFKPGIIKPLPITMLKRIPAELSLGRLQLNNARVEYTEVNNKNGLSGTVPVTRMNVRITNAKNYMISPTDSLSIQATGYLMDTAWLNLRVKESYTDSLGGFLMTLRIKPADLRILNPVLIPLVSIKLESGYLDTLNMRAVGREYLAMGEMEMHYHDLKVRLLKNGDESRKSFLTGILNLLIKNKNTSRKGRVFFVRQRDKSAINYMIKMTLSGMASSTGIKSNKKMMRKYRKEILQRNLPPIDLE